MLPCREGICSPRGYSWSVHLLPDVLKFWLGGRTDFPPSPIPALGETLSAGGRQRPDPWCRGTATVPGTSGRPRSSGRGPPHPKAWDGLKYLQCYSLWAARVDLGLCQPSRWHRRSANPASPRVHPGLCSPTDRGRAGT